MKKGMLIAGAIIGCLTGASLAACGSSTSGTGTTGTHTTTGTHSTTTSMTGTGGTGTTTSNTTTTTSATTGTTTTSTTGTCQTDPTLHPADAGALYCGFGADGGSLTCPVGQQCCIGNTGSGTTFAPDDCETWGSVCQNPPPPKGGLAVPCEQPSDCTANGHANNICCLMGSAPVQVPGCDALDLKASGGTGTQCVSGTSCGTGNTQLCLADSDCPTGQTCHAFRWKIIQMGACM